jgi:hypothetical protein
MTPPVLVVSLEFFFDIFLAALWPWVRLRNIFRGVKGGRYVELTIVSPSYDDCLEIWEPQTPGTLRVSPGLYRDFFTFTSL